MFVCYAKTLVDTITGFLPRAAKPLVGEMSA